MLTLLLADLADGPKDNLFGYVVTALATLILSVLTYLVTSIRKQEGTAADYLKNMLDQYDKRESMLIEEKKEADGRLAHAWNEHEKERLATMHRADEIAKLLSKVAVDNHAELKQDLNHIKNKLRGKSEDA
jgi:hypothetical protein